MAIELVDGHSGRGHIGGDDKGSLHAGIVGRESVALDVGSVLACSMAGANAATVGTGDVLVHGRHVRVTAPERLTIESGTQGQKRNDVIAVHYHRAGDVETATLEVIKGTAGDSPKDPPMPSDGNALDGAADDYMPLWRIPIDGINAGEPQQLFRVVPPVVAVASWAEREDAKPAIADGSLSDMGTSVTRVGELVQAVVNVTMSYAHDTGSTLCTLPPSMRPAAEFDATGAGWSTDWSPMPLWLSVSASGEVKIKEYIAGGKELYQVKAQFCYLRAAAE